MRGSLRTSFASRRGFSLFEIVVAIAVLFALSATVFGFFFELFRQRELVERGATRELAAAMLIERMETDLSAAIAGAGEAGIAGDNHRLRVLARGVTPALTPAMVALGDLQGVEFRFDPDSGRLEIRRWDVLASAVEGEFEDLGVEFDRVRFRYFSGRQWQASFDSMQAATLPAAIEVAVWFRSQDGSRASGNDEESAGVMREEGENVRTSPAVFREPDRVRVIVIPDGPPRAAHAFGEEEA
ncbi:MAG: hypothetical protein KF866_03010 [Phycisphaeraceae bacterium]|nr:hypothetical protein [Phycisphaeraceae bacterium]